MKDNFHDKLLTTSKGIESLLQGRDGQFPLIRYHERYLPFSTFFALLGFSGPLLMLHVAVPKAGIPHGVGESDFTQPTMGVKQLHP